MTCAIDTPRLYITFNTTNSDETKQGFWIDAFDLSDDVLDVKIKEMGVESYYDISIEDNHNFHGINIDKYSDFETVSEIAQMLNDDRWDADLIAELYNHLNGSNPQDVLDYLDEHYQGEHKNLEEWCREFLDDTGFFETCNEHIKIWFDYVGYAEYVETSGDIFTLDVNGGLHVFWNR